MSLKSKGGNGSILMFHEKDVKQAVLNFRDELIDSANGTINFADEDLKTFDKIFGDFSK